EYELDENGERVIRWFPKMQTSCSMEMTDGMVVHTQETSEEVARAQKDTMELILINHPLDCPICDQAGECPLQIQTYKYGPEGSRFEVKKVHKPKRV
ncbi:MAG TPA: (2Fe-2S)-binding protein, partial [Balneola sp.]|nr:(2Fe-2S)-binding protein [Balneola sp.]